MWFLLVKEYQVKEHQGITPEQIAAVLSPRNRKLKVPLTSKDQGLGNRVPREICPSQNRCERKKHGERERERELEGQTRYHMRVDAIARSVESES